MRKGFRIEHYGCDQKTAYAICDNYQKINTVMIFYFYKETKAKAMCTDNTVAVFKIKYKTK